MQVKADDIDAWLRRPAPGIAGIVLYGPDRGLVSERAQAFAATTGLALDDPFSVIRLDAAEIDASPGRLTGEMQTLAMFADRRLIWLRNAGAQKEIVEAMALAEAGGTDAVLLVEAGDLKKTSSLRQAAEAGRRLAALPCYGDDPRRLDALIDALVQAEGRTLTLEARSLLRDRLGGDRLASRGEIVKLLLYVGDRTRIEADDVLAVCGDAAAVSVDAAIDALLAGDAARFDSAYGRSLQAGQHPFVALSAAMRQYQLLATLRAAIDRDGRSAAAAVAAARPPVFFARKTLVEGTLQRLSAAAIAAALDRLQAAVLATRRNAELAPEIARQALLALTLANRPRRDGRFRN